MVDAHDTYPVTYIAHGSDARATGFWSVMEQPTPATIAPSLIHLLNTTSQTPQIPHSDLPSNQSSAPEPPIPERAEPDRPNENFESYTAFRGRYDPVSGDHNDAAPAGAPAVAPAVQQGLYCPDDFTFLGRRQESDPFASAVPPVHPAVAYPAATLPGPVPVPATVEPPAGGRDAFFGYPGIVEESLPRRPLLGLPQPVQQKPIPSQQAIAALGVPPIINGLHCPPEPMDILPPMTSNTLTEPSRAQFTYLPDLPAGPSDQPRPEESHSAPGKSDHKTRRPPKRPRRKWEEHETRDLLTGVSKHGLGKWTAIVEDAAFDFGGRSAADLKDRFRTCWPQDVRIKLGIPTSNKAGSTVALQVDPTNEADATQPPLEYKEPKRRKRTMVHRERINEMVQDGVNFSFKKSSRRERVPFTQQDDEQIMEGLALYGPSWTKIKADPRYNFSERHPTDLRDRIRNKYPEVFKKIENGTITIRNRPKVDDLMEPSITTSISNSLQPSTSTPVPIPVPGPAPPSALNPQISHLQPLDEISRWAPLTENSPFERPNLPTSLQEVEESSIAQPTAGGMDLSRLLLLNTPPPQANPNRSWGGDLLPNLNFRDGHILNTTYPNEAPNEFNGRTESHDIND